jgi:transposase
MEGGNKKYIAYRKFTYKWKKESDERGVLKWENSTKIKGIEETFTTTQIQYQFTRNSVASSQYM